MLRRNGLLSCIQSTTQEQLRATNVKRRKVRPQQPIASLPGVLTRAATRAAAAQAARASTTTTSSQYLEIKVPGEREAWVFGNHLNSEGFRREGTALDKERPGPRRKKAASGVVQGVVQGRSGTWTKHADGEVGSYRVRRKERTEDGFVATADNTAKAKKARKA